MKWKSWTRRDERYWASVYVGDGIWIWKRYAIPQLLERRRLR